MKITEYKGNQMVSVYEASRLTGLSVYLLRKGIKSGLFPALQMVEGGKYLLDLGVITEVLATGTISRRGVE